MSLPNRANFYNIYGDLIGDCFVNIGWWIDNRGLARIIVEQLPSAAMTNPKVHYVELYEFSFPIEMVIDMRSAGLQAAEIFLSEFRLVETTEDERR
jgi:hypothetical protein